ncbi:MAG: FKBP-type peptidyl-prolyl cis-trans isomerase [Bacteroidales bacterium]
MKLLQYFILIHLLAFFLFSCKEKTKKKSFTTREISQIKENLVGVHKYLVGKDADSIKRYSDSNYLDLQESRTGLWYRVYCMGNGEPIKTGDRVSIDYRVSFLNNKTVYTSDSIGIKHFIVGRGGVESGLEEGILLMCKGDSALFVMPPHLAYGVAGDGRKIPRLSIIKYNVTVVDVVKPKR